MKLKINPSIECCEKCGKTPTIEFFRRGDNGDNCNTIINLCRDCLVKAIKKCFGQTATTKDKKDLNALYAAVGKAEQIATASEDQQV